MDSTSETAQVRELKGFRLYGFAFGSFGLILPFAMYNGYVFQYYVYVVGLDALLTSIGLFSGLFCYAFFAPIFGVISDNKSPGRFGKRRIFFLYGIMPFILLNILIWTPPLCPQDDPHHLATFFYYLLMSCGLNIAVVSMFSPYMAMIPEQCQTEKNRVLVASLQGLFNIFGSVIGILLPMILQSMLVDPTKTRWWQPSGEFLVQRIPLIGGLFAFIGATFVLITFFTTDESFLKENSAQNQKKTIKETFQQVFRPIQDKKYKPFLVQTVFWNMGMRILMVVILPLLTFVLLLQGVEFIIFVLIIIPFAFGGFLFWNLKIPKYGLLSGYRYSILISIMMLLLTPLFLLDFSQTLKLALAVIVMGLALACLVAGFLFPTPIVSALVDEAAIIFAENMTVAKNTVDNKSECVSQLSGGYYGLFSFTINFSSGLANLILGGIFIGSNSENPFYIVLSLPVAAILFFLSWGAIRKLSLNNSK